VLAVGDSNPDDTPASFSSYGSNLGVLAPGVAADACSAVYTATNATSAYTCGYSGTSFATPIVSSLAALVLQENPSLSAAQVVSLIEQNADEVAAMDGQSHTLMEGYGRIDVAKTLAAATADTTTVYGSPSNSVCVGFPGAVCDLQLIGPQAQIVDLGQVTLDQAGNGEYSWDPAALGLAEGQWQLVTRLYAGTAMVTLPAKPVTLSW
jgi:subtilisin family serine protease